jgi:calnexin
MFGPDKCGPNNKVHFIVRHKNPVSGKYEEKHLKNPPNVKMDTKTHLYSLHILKDNTFKVLIDNEEVRTGSLLEEFDPPFNPPEVIDDPDDKKPEDWVDEAKIPDPSAVKPDDWDETAPAQIIDVDDTKPDTWQDNEPLEIPDPEATKPEDWEDDLDGEWEAPLVRNPKCADGQCGTWKPRYIANPAYKGKWKPPLIDNPDYIGVWAPRKIPNPYFFVDEHPHNLEKMRAIGIEIWTMKDRIFFDNFIISYKKGEVDKFTSIWEQRKDDEEIIEAEERAKRSSPILDQITTFAKDNVILVVVIVVVLIVSIIFCFCFPNPPVPTTKVASTSTTVPASTTPAPGESKPTPPKKKKQKAD